MKTRIWKLLALVLALACAMSGCSLIEIDQEMDMAEVVATVGDAKITKGDVINDYVYQLNYMAYMYSYYGISDTLTNDQIESIKNDVLDVYIAEELLRQKAEELALTDFSEEFYAEADQLAADYFEESIVSHAEHVDTEGLTEEAAREAVIEHLADDGITMESLKESYRSSAVSELVYEHVIADVAVSDEEIQAAYEAKLAEDEETYANSTYLYETYKANGEIITWNPEGYRTVKHILFLLNEEQETALTDLENQLYTVELDIAELEAAETAEETEEAAEEAAEESAESEEPAEEVKTLDELNAEKASIEQQIADLKAEIVASFKEQTDSVYARLEAGENFDDLMAELGQDPGMQSEPNMTTGYYVCETSTTWDVNFRDAAMALEAIGDVSEPVLSSSGLHIVYYNSDVTPGAVDIETVREALTEEALSAKQDEVYTAQYDQWLKEANVKKYPKVLG